VFGRFSTWQQKEEQSDGTMAENKAKSLMRYGAGFNWYWLRRSGGAKPATMFQFAWIHEQTNAEKPEGGKVDPTDTFIAQFRFEWNHVLPAP
jgi:hypothetical protein